MSTSKVFRGGDKLRARLKELAKKVESGKEVRCGYLEGAHYPDGTPVATVAVIQEFGAPNASIPPRPFFRTMIKAQSDTWGDTLGALLVQDGYDARKSLGTLGEIMAGDLKQSVADVNSPPLSETTLMLRKMRSEDQSLVVTGATVGEAARRVAQGESTSGVNTKPLNDINNLLADEGISFEVQ